MSTLKDFVSADWWNHYATAQMVKMQDVNVVKEFGVGWEKPWVSWQEFGTHKNVMYWCLLENGYAVGFNENPSVGQNYVVKKLSKEQFEKYKNHTHTYEWYRQP